MFLCVPKCMTSYKANNIALCTQASAAGRLVSRRRRKYPEPVPTFDALDLSRPSSCRKVGAFNCKVTAHNSGGHKDLSVAPCCHRYLYQAEAGFILNSQSHMNILIGIGTRDPNGRAVLDTARCTAWEFKLLKGIF